MSKKFVLVLALFSASSLTAFAADECKPAIGDSSEVATILADGETTGKDAAAEINAARAAVRQGSNAGMVNATVDLFGRELSVVTRKQIGVVASVVVNENYGNARIERYCSASNAKNAKCVNICVRWTNYVDSRI